MFEITEFTEARIASVTNRTEAHGDERVPAVSLGLEFEFENTRLDLIDPTLRHALYKPKPEAEPELPGVEQSTPVLRSNSIDRVKLITAHEGWTLKVDDNIDAEDPLVFGGCKVDAFSVEPKQGGTIVLRLRVGTSDVDAERLGYLGVNNGQAVWVQLLKPEKAPERTGTEATGAEIDGTKGHPALEGQGSLLDQPTPETALAGAVAGDASITEGAGAGDGPDDEAEGFDEEEDEGAAPDLETRLDSALAAADAGASAASPEPERGPNWPFPGDGQTMTDAQAKAAGTGAAEDGPGADAKPGRRGRKTAAVVE